MIIAIHLVLPALLHPKILETKLLSRFDKLSTELLNVKDVIIKNLQSEKTSKGKLSLENKVFLLKPAKICLSSMAEVTI